MVPPDLNIPRSFCRHCKRDTESATDVIEVGSVRYDVSYCSECGIANSAFRLSKDGKSKGAAADNILLRKMHRPARK